MIMGLLRETNLICPPIEIYIPGAYAISYGL